MANKILIADDEPDILEILQYNLRAEGYEVFTAKNGNEAIEVAKINNPQLIILDIMMPEKSGIEACAILRAMPMFRKTFIIFLTALSDEVTEIKGLETGAGDFIAKPVSPRGVMSKVNAFFRRLEHSGLGKIQINQLEIDRESFVVR